MHRFAGELDRRARLSPQRGRGLLRHIDVFWCVENFEVEGAGSRMSRELALDQVPVPCQQETNLQVPGGDERPVDD